MADAFGELRTERLLQGGFALACCWAVDGDGVLRLSGDVPKAPGVYAFAIDGIVQYVGVASASLAKRLYFYGKPGPSQTTNIRLNAMLVEALSKDASIEVYVATPPDLEWNGWGLSGPEGLEAGIIKRFRLPWNQRGTARLQAGTPQAEVAAQSPPQRVPVTQAGPVSDKYRPLREHLSRCMADKVSMTFAEIQALVGPLPRSATLHRAWWANHQGNTQARGWMPARYVAQPDPPHQTVVFRRI